MTKFTGTDIAPDGFLSKEATLREWRDAEAAQRERSRISWQHQIADADRRIAEAKTATVALEAEIDALRTTGPRKLQFPGQDEPMGLNDRDARLAALHAQGDNLAASIRTAQFERQQAELQLKHSDGNVSLLDKFRPNRAA